MHSHGHPARGCTHRRLSALVGVQSAHKRFVPGNSACTRDITTWQRVLPVHSSAGLDTAVLCGRFPAQFWRLAVLARWVRGVDTSRAAAAVSAALIQHDPVLRVRHAVLSL